MNSGEAVVTTSAGRVRGQEISDGILSWRGIPYAEPPVGDLRFRPPRPPRPWAGVHDATACSARAIQPDGVALAGFRRPSDDLPTSEDCLYLNVSAPAGASGRPVLVWVHGGGYLAGAGIDMAGDGAAFARSHGLVVVTFNYRLGALGFLDIEGEQPTGAHGLHDQIAALRWVGENIAAFGGDPGQVTIYGLSAGAKSVSNLLASPLTAGLIRRAAFSSGGADHVKQPGQAARLTRRFRAELGTSLLRQVPADEILAAQNAIATGITGAWVWRPSIDGTALTRRPIDAIAGGAAQGIPLLAQTCGNEAALYQLAAPDAASQADRVLEDYFGAHTRDRILATYAKSRPALADDPISLRVAVMTDERYGIPSTRVAEAHSGHAPVWRSRYDGPLTGLPDPLPGQCEPFAELLRASHGSDGTGIWQGGHGISGLLHGIWGSFADGGVPRADGLPGWPGYNPVRRATMIIDPAGSHVSDDPRAPEREAWDGLDWTPGTWWRFDGLD